MAEWSLSVSELNEYVRLKLAGDAMLRSVSVRGEISGFKRHVSGHMYFILKDDKARVQCAMFRGQAARLDFAPEDGQQVVVAGAAGLYAVSGTYQLYVDSMRREGAGDLYLRFEKLKAKLAAEGLFDPSVKKPLPFMPRRIGVATSLTGAAFRDIARVARARNPRVEILICPCAVQGAGAAREIAESVRALDRDGKCDVILVGRGGGSMEDLWAVNEEIVARAIFACDTPVVSCVGHEIDFTIADFVADARAATPSNAAELAVGDAAEARAALEGLRRRLTGALVSGERQRRLRLNALGQSPILKSPEKMLLANKRDALSRLQNRLRAAENRCAEKRRTRLRLMERTLSAVNPQNVLARGYACVRADGRVVSDARLLEPGAHIRIDLRGGRADATVDRVFRDSAESGKESAWK